MNLGKLNSANKFANLAAMNAMQSKTGPANAFRKPVDANPFVTKVGAPEINAVGPASKMPPVAMAFGVTGNLMQPEHRNAVLGNGLYAMA
jgi:hypothetical protein